MKYILPLLMFSFWASAQVSIGTPTPHSSAILHLESTNLGLLLPRYSGSTPGTAGLARFNTANGCFEYHDGSNWRCAFPSTGASPTARISAFTTHSGFTSATVSTPVSATLTINYTGGNGGSLTPQVVTNVGASAGNLTATLISTSVATGSGSVSYNISGTPLASGPSFFVLNVGDKIYVVSFTINP